MRFVAHIAQALIAALLAMSTVEAAAQPIRIDDPSTPLSSYTVESWSPGDDHPRLEISAIERTSDGFLWLAGRGGLLRFDGTRFRRLPDASGFAAGRLSALHEDHAGNLWIGSPEDGIAVHSTGTLSVHDAGPELSSRRVTSLSADDRGHVWIGTADAGITILRGGTVERLAVNEGLPGPSISALHAGAGSTMWIGSPDGWLARYTADQLEVFDLGRSGVTALLEEESGHLWIGTRGDGLLRLDEGRLSRVTTGAVHALAPHPSGGVWAGTEDGRLMHAYDGGSDGFPALDSLIREPVTALHVDQDGDLWVAAGDASLHQIRKSRFATFGVEDGLAHERVYSVVEDRRGSIWMATETGITSFSDGRATTLEFVHDGIHPPVTSLASARDGSLWIGTRGAGLHRYERGRLSAYAASNELPDHDVFALHEDDRGDLWIGTGGGVTWLTDGRFTTITREDGLSGNDVTSIASGTAGDLWVGTYDSGLNLLREGRVVATFGTRDGLPSDRVLTVSADSDGDVWIGTRGGGLALLRGDRFAAITPRAGLFASTIYQILEDDRGFLWMSSDRGLFRVAKRELNAFADGRRTTVTSIVYDSEDGVTAGSFQGGFQPAGLRATDGRLWFPTRRGVLTVNPEAPAAAESAPLVSLQRLSVDGEAIPLDDPIQVPPGGRRFRFEYASAAFHDANRQQYRYRLDGVDDDWVYAGARRAAYYANLAPGTYTFSVESSNGDGKWSGRPTSTTLQFAAYFYETAIFRLLCIIGVALLILTAYRWRMRRLREREHELLELIEMHTRHLREEKEKTERALAETDRARHEAEQQSEIAQRARAVIEEQAERLRELDRIKTRFFNNVSHEFRTPLALTIGPLENMLAGVSGPLGPETCKQVDLALRNSRRLLRLINQLLDLSKLESGEAELTVCMGNVVPLIEGVVMSFTAYAEKRNLELSFSSDHEEVSLCFDAAILEKVLFNLLSNAVKFTDEGGEVEVSVRDGEAEFGEDCLKAVLIHVRDSGIGIPDEQLPYIFDRFHQVDGAAMHAHEGTGIGLSLVKELVALHHGTVTVRSEAGVGSEFVIALPKGSDHFGDDVLFWERPSRGVSNVSRGPMMEMAVLSDDDRWTDVGGDGDSARHGDRSMLLPFAASNTSLDAALEANVTGGISSASTRAGGSAASSQGGALIGESRDERLADVPQADAPDSPPVRGDESPAHDRSNFGGGSIHQHLHAPASGRAPLDKPTILIVDDNPEVVDYVAGALDDEYAVISAISGDEALDMAHRRAPSLVISDVMMPGMDGYELCRRIKSDETLRHVPVILLTARAAQDDKIEGLEAGSDDYISKPFSTRELKARVRNLLTVRDQQRLLADLNTELSRKNEALREASEMKSQLLSIAAHDMKNPLNAIREFAQILKNEVGRSSNHYDPLNLIHQSSDQMLHLVSTLLDSAAMEAGQMALHCVPLDLNALAKAVVRQNENLAAKKDQTIELATPADGCVVSADEGRMLEAMDNLVNNAVKYSPHHRPIRVAVERTDSAIRFSVTDEGPGLTSDDRTKLFRKFQRLSARPTGGETSTGLGLAIVKQIVDMHGGAVEVQSEVGAGSTFSIELPLTMEDRR